MHFRIIDIIASWLGTRQANVVVGGTQSETFQLSDMVYQGTVLGPILWNLFFGDAHFAIRLAKFTEMMFADDLQAYRSFKQTVPNGTLLRSAKTCQSRLHEWGRANQVAFDSNKESITILSRQTPSREEFRTLGIIFDPGLYMEGEICEISNSAS